MTKTDIILASDQTPEITPTTSPLILLQLCPSSSSFEAGLVELKVLKSHRKMVVKVKEISEGVTVQIFIIRNGETFEEISISNESGIKVTFDLEKNDGLAFGYVYPTEVVSNPKINFKLLVQKKH